MTKKHDSLLGRAVGSAVARVRVVAKMSAEGSGRSAAAAWLEDEDESEKPTTPVPAMSLDALPASTVREIMPLEAIPWLMLSFAQVTQLALDHRSGFLLSLIDGRTSVETLLDLCGWEPTEALTILAKWRLEGVIDLR